MSAAALDLPQQRPCQLRPPPLLPAAGDAPAPQLPRAVPAAIFRAMADLLGDPSWPRLHPRPSTDTPWPGLQCEVSPDDAPRLHFGPDVASPPCRPRARLDAASLRGLPHLRTLSIFGCFAAAHDDVELPPELFADAAPSSSSLEQIVLKSNPGLRGPIPATLSGLRSLLVLSLSQNGFRHPCSPTQLWGAGGAPGGAWAALQAAGVFRPASAAGG